jgi:hypothetical protein
LALFFRSALGTIAAAVETMVSAEPAADVVVLSYSNVPIDSVPSTKKHAQMARGAGDDPACHEVAKQLCTPVPP